MHVFVYLFILHGLVFCQEKLKLNKGSMPVTLFPLVATFVVF